MSIDTREYGRGTSTTSRYPWGTYVTARVLCSDGRVRQVKRIAPTADSFFSVPAAVTVQGRTVSGYVTVETLAGFDTDTADDPAVVKFVAYTYGANGHLLRPGTYRECSRCGVAYSSLDRTHAYLECDQ